jgi:hypothetical protein
MLLSRVVFSMLDIVEVASARCSGSSTVIHLSFRGYDLECFVLVRHKVRV